MNLADGREVPEVCIEVLNELDNRWMDNRWPGAALEQARIAVVEAVLAAYTQKKSSNPGAFLIEKKLTTTEFLDKVRELLTEKSSWEIGIPDGGYAVRIIHSVDGKIFTYMSPAAIDMSSREYMEFFQELNALVGDEIAYLGDVS